MFLELFAVAGFVSLFAAFVVLLAYKLGIVEWLQVHGSKEIAELAHCDFCMSWWASVVITAIVAPFVCEWWLFAVPFIATPLARHWL